MKRLLMTVAALFLAQAAQAADISIVVDETADHPAIIMIKGQIGDMQEAHLFSALAGYQRKAVVFLDSPGGRSTTSVQIGLAIRNHGLSTAVVDGAQCSSGCALVWLGGVERYMGTKANIGFHAARVSLDKAEVASGANAVTGAYLYQIGITSFDTIMQLTSPPPETMRWIKFYGDTLTYKLGAKELIMSSPQWTWAREALAAPKLATRTVGQ
jgi:hypothetical protein